MVDVEPGMPADERAHGAKVVRVQLVISVEEADELGVAPRHAVVAALSDAELLLYDHLDPCVARRIAAGDGRGLVGGAIIDDDEAPIRAALGED